MRILAADHVLPISSEPIRNGAVAVDGSQIIEVGLRAGLIEKFPSADVEDFGQAAILPGLVNCHAHLELTALRGALDDVEHDFRSWLLKINSLRAELSDDEIVQWAIAGAREAAAAGVTCIGDIGRFGHAGVAAMKEVGLRGIVHQETEFSPDNATADEDFKNLAEKFEKLHGESTDLVRVGLSPHSPYTVGSRLFELVAQYAIINRVPLTIHTAESADEDALMTSGEGFFTEVYEKFDVEWNSPHCTSIEYLERLGVLSTRPLLAHCVTASDSDIERIKSNGAKIAHCPKSNAKFGHGYAPFEKFLDAGIAVGLGSDSVASNNVCDLLEESRFAVLTARNRAHGGSTNDRSVGGSSSKTASPPDVRLNRSRKFLTARQALETATLGGAKALGLDHLIGTLDPGKRADIAVITLDNLAQQPINDIEAGLVFSSGARSVIRNMVSGRVVYDSPAEV